MTASKAATAGGSAFGSWFDGFLPIVGALLLIGGMLFVSVVEARSGLGTDTGCVGSLAGSVIVRAGERGLGAEVNCVLGATFFREIVLPFFSSSDSIGGAAVYLNALGTIILLAWSANGLLSQPYIIGPTRPISTASSCLTSGDRRSTDVATTKSPATRSSSGPRNTMS